MRVALYARVSTVDKDQNPETQLRLLREYAERMEWEPTEYVDYASAKDLTHRTAWRDMLATRPDVILVTKIDRAWRSTLAMLVDVSAWRAAGRSIVAITQGIDTTNANPMATLQLSLMGAFAEFESMMISERTREGLARAREQGTRTGRGIGKRGPDKNQRRLRGSPR